MDKQDMIAFFDGLASGWDAGQIHDDEKIDAILDYAGITENVSVLDVACGTGVLMPDYLARGVKKVTGIDISPVMIAMARRKFSDPRVEFFNMDIEEAALPEQYDRCMVYNAFPHFPDPSRLIEGLAGKLALEGRLTVAHSMSRAQINRHHSGKIANYSVSLPSETELALFFRPYFNVDVALSNDRIYVVSGTKRKSDL